uniref:Odorant-binding protein 10 n=1 Tax=Streltzoviella insularis TaxID=1206366 RepID=A0A7D5UMJ5_9NEOP|nr:odorant-binding protein 10 [Streltzoviella insularis]
MVTVVAFLALLPSLVTSATEGNIHLLEDEIALALRACSYPDTNTNIVKGNEDQRQTRYVRSSNRFYDEQSPKIDSGVKEDMNQYGHEKRNATDMRIPKQIHVLNTTEYNYGCNDTERGGKRQTSSVTRPEFVNESANNTRVKRTEPLLDDSDQCLSQCVFANLEVIDSRGIPLEAELWNRVQSSLASQQSRVALRDQIRACFQELETDGNDNGCSFSNKLERCLMLNFSERKMNGTI